jgi:hypothetical protein
MATKPEIKYVRVGQVERPVHYPRQKLRYQWRDGWSEDGNTFPWLTKREAQADARSRGARAVFVGKENSSALPQR